MEEVPLHNRFIKTKENKVCVCVCTGSQRRKDPGVGCSLHSVTKLGKCRTCLENGELSSLAEDNGR